MIKQRVMRVFHQNITIRGRDRENAFKVYIHEQQRLMKFGMKVLNDNIKSNRKQRINKYKAFKYLSKIIKKRAMQAFKMSIQIKKNKE